MSDKTDVSKSKMHLLPQNAIFRALAPHEKFFLELWHGMTHELSLDSYRVRCLNARTIVRELDLELRNRLLDQPELNDLCEEANEILASDPLIPLGFSRHLAHTLPFLQKPPQLPDEKKKDASAEQIFREFKFTIADFSSALELDYIKRLIEAIPDLIATGGETKSQNAVGALLSDLVDQGWPLESLFGWVDLFAQAKLPPYGTFNGNLQFLLRQLGWGKQPFRVILHLSGSSKLAGLGKFEAFQFSRSPSFTSNTPAQTKFAAPGQLVAFAETEVQAVNHAAAAIAGRESFESCLDRMRFNFEPSPLGVLERCFVERKGDRRIELVTVRHLVPNPTHHLTADAFREFSEGINTVLNRSSIDSESAERLRAAIRHYRFGRDADSYKDKFLNWWMGLEFLTYVGEGFIGRTVARHTSDTLMQRYLARLLGDLLRTIKLAKIEWSTSLAAHTLCSKLQHVKLPELVKILQSQAHAEELAKAFVDHPVVAFRVRRLASVLDSPAKTAALLNTHYRHLKWQVERLYRIRCCIVHGSRIQFKLPLFAANLEFYLKELIIVSLRTLGLHPHIASLKELFQRAQVARERIERELTAPNAPIETVQNAVFTSSVLQETV